MQKRGKLPGVHKVHPWHPPDYKLAEGVAVQAVALGNATEDQQRRAMRFIIEKLCETYGMSYRPDSARDTDFAEGKRFVGLQLVKHIKTDFSALRGKQSEQGGPKPTEQR